MGNFETYLYLKSNIGTYKYYPNLSLNSLRYDNELNKFTTSTHGYSYGYKNKELYEVKNNTFELIKGAEVNPDNSDNNVIKFYKIVNNKKVYYLTLKDTNSKISVYDTAIFKGESY